MIRIFVLNNLKNVDNDQDTQKFLDLEGCKTFSDFTQKVLPLECILEDGVIKITRPQQNLDKIKQEYFTKISNKFLEFEQNVCKEMQVVSSLGFIVDADIRSQRNLQGLLDIGEDHVLYMCGDNIARTLTLEQLKIIKKECILNSQNLYKQKWRFEQAIEMCDSEDDLKRLDLNFKMLNFNI